MNFEHVIYINAVVCPVFGYLSHKAFRADKDRLADFFGVMCLLSLVFSAFIPVYIVFIIFLVVAFFDTVMEYGDD